VELSAHIANLLILCRASLQLPSTKEEEIDIKMEPLMVDPESEEDSYMQEDISDMVESTMLEKVKEEPEFSSSDHNSPAICCIPSCGQKQSSDIRLFGFPKDC